MTQRKSGNWVPTPAEPGLLRGELNDLGVIVGRGDVPPIGPDGVGYTHTLAVPLFGPHAGKWIDLGTLGGEQPKGWEEPNNDISNTGLVVSQLHRTRRAGARCGVDQRERPR